jgi:deoxyribonuclease V
MDLDQLEEEQAYLAKQIYIPQEEIDIHPYSIIFGVDIQYVEETAYVAMAAYSHSGKLLETFALETATGMEYVPGYFCFREGPPILRTIRKILATQNLIPDLMLIDGHGIAHPRRLGVASYVGLQTNIPTIGIAKKALLHYEGDLAPSRGSHLDIRLNNETVGAVLRTQDDIKPVFVSPGYKISLQQSIDITLNFSNPYRLANPIRSADQAARAYAKGETIEGGIIL